MSINKVIPLFAFLFSSVLCYSQIVNDASELNNAINSASAGSTIVLANGTWNDVFIEIEKNGSNGNPITIAAENPGSVLMTGNSRVYMEGAYLIVSGLVFQDPDDLETSGNSIEPVIELKDCDNCKVIGNKIDAYNGTEEQKDMTFKWVLNDGQNNEIAYNSFVGKYGVGSIINDNRNSPEPDFLLIHHNYFADRTPINAVNEDNDQDAIRLGNSGTSLDESMSEIYENYFFNFKGEIEIISNKSGSNKYYNNTFRDYSGTLALRHGNDCEVYGNYFFAENSVFSGGIRIIGENHKVYNNYIEGINSFKPDGSLSNGTGGINISNGRLNTELNGYAQVQNTQVINNTFVNCDYGLRIGTDIAGDLDQEPQNLTVANNIMYNSSAADIAIVTQPSGDWISEGNITDLPDSVLLDDGIFHRLAEGSVAVDAGLGDYSFLTQDILGGTRDANIDAGAEEYGGNGVHFPYEAEDLGVYVGFGANSSTIAPNRTVLDFSVCGSSTTFTVISNVDWTIEENLTWLTLDVISGSGVTVVTATTGENGTGEERSGTIAINEVVGGENASVSITLVQSLGIIPFEIPVIGTSSIGMQIKDEIAEENAYNDDLSNYWTGDPATEEEVSITFDLGDLHFLTSVGINFWKADERSTTFSIAVSDDASGPFTVVLDNVTSSTGDDISVDIEQFFELGGISTRYVKFIGIGNSSSSSWTSIANVNIYGDFNCENAALPIGIIQIEEIENDIHLYPMPVSNGTLNVSSENAGINRINIFNTVGTRVLVDDGNGKSDLQIDVSMLIPGIYFMQLENLGQLKLIIR